MTQPLSLLVVDDDEVDRLAVRRALAGAGWVDVVIQEATDAPSAIDALLRGRFDCALLDYYMGSGTAQDVVEAARARGDRTPIIVLTGQGDEQIAVNLMKAGASDYMAKAHLTSDLLNKSLQNVLRVREAERVAAEAQAGLSYLAEVSDVLAHSLEFDTTAERTLKLLVGRMADYAALYLDHPSGLTRALSLHVDPAALEALDTLLEGDLGAPLAAFFAQEGTDGPWHSLEGVGTAGEGVACMAMPLVARGHRLGMLLFVCVESPERYPQSQISLGREVARRAAMALDNARLYQLAREAIQMREAFLSIASHELKNPITTIQGYAELLARRQKNASEWEQRTVQTLLNQSRRMNKMLESLLDLSRIESGQLHIERVPMDFAELLHELMGELTEMVSSHALTLDIVGDGPYTMCGDPVRLEQVVNNLVQNAIKYSPAGGEIAVTLWREGESLCLSVRDSGLGISDAALPYLFERFYRAPSRYSEAIKGAGLGLFVVREIVSRHGGQVEVESREGEGSAFHLSLPAAPGEDGQRAAAGP